MVGLPLAEWWVARAGITMIHSPGLRGGGNLSGPCGKRWASFFVTAPTGLAEKAGANSSAHFESLNNSGTLRIQLPQRLMTGCC
jgi:hypothetical protein